jgi:hypothetical protein
VSTAQRAQTSPGTPAGRWGLVKTMSSTAPPFPPPQLCSGCARARGPVPPLGAPRTASYRRHSGHVGDRIRLALTSVDVTVRMRSRSSTNCLKVGLCEGTACQHSLMIMYLGAEDSGMGARLARCSPWTSPKKRPRLPAPPPPCHIPGAEATVGAASSSLGP